MNEDQAGWSSLYKYRKNIEKRFGSLWSLPVKKRYHNVLDRYVISGAKILEIGAGERKLKQRLERSCQGVDYVSCDIDDQYEHEFKQFSEITGSYNIICAFELIEHLTLDSARKMLNKCYEVTADEGVILLTTPNIYYPPAYLRDATHITAFSYDELGGLMESAGFEVTAIYRLYHDALLKKVIRRYLLYPLFRAINIDFSRQIAVVAKKKS